MIEMPVANQNQIRAFHIDSSETEWRKHTAAIEIGVQKNDLAVKNKLKIRIAGPSDRERPWIFGKSAADGHQNRSLTTRVISLNDSLAHESWVSELSSRGHAAADSDCDQPNQIELKERFHFRFPSKQKVCWTYPLPHLKKTCSLILIYLQTALYNFNRSLFA